MCNEPIVSKNIFFLYTGITQEATDDDSFIQTEPEVAPIVAPPAPIERVEKVERSRSPSPPTEKEEPAKEEEEEESILSPSRKGDATEDSGTGTGGTSIPSTPDSVFLERTLDRSDIESTSG